MNAETTESKKAALSAPKAPKKLSSAEGKKNSRPSRKSTSSTPQSKSQILKTIEEKGGKVFGFKNHKQYLVVLSKDSMTVENASALAMTMSANGIDGFAVMVEGDIDKAMKVYELDSEYRKEAEEMSKKLLEYEKEGKKV